jgi:DNA invertase Pin-like site-specific DNA recombinase
MSNWWEHEPAAPQAIDPSQRAVAYYRHSAADRQENSIPIQQSQVHKWAKENRFQIIHEFADAGKSGLNAEGRPAFTEMMEEWVKKRYDFAHVICLDVSRWGRFQDLDVSALYCAECRKHGKEVQYANLGPPRKNDRLRPVLVQLERYRAGEYSHELSGKVFNGCVWISQQGYWAGGPPPYGMRRLLLDEKREPVQLLEPGQRKSIQNQRVTLT